MKRATPNSVKIIGLDPGFGNFKAATICSERISTTTLPAVVGAGKLGPQIKIEFGQQGSTRKVSQPVEIQADFGSYLAGPNVHLHARAIERLDFERLAQGVELQALTYATLFNLLGKGTHRIKVLIGLPMQIYIDPETRLSTQARLSKMLCGEHEFQANGQPVTLAVETLKVTAQPLGSFFYHGMNLAGQWTSTDHPHAPVAVADLGFNTVDLFVIQDAQVSNRYSNGDNLGMRRAIKILRDQINENFGVSPSLHECDNLIRSHHKRTEALVHHNTGSSDVSQMIRTALDASFGEVAAHLGDTWGEAKNFRRILFTGGGATVYRDQLARLYPRATVLTEAPLANAIGFAKFAQRNGVI